MRVITEHRLDQADPIAITVEDAADASGASHRYLVSGFDAEDNQACPEGWTGRYDQMVVLFQNGPIGERGFNGVTQEVLLAIVADRLRSFQQGPYPSPENEQALSHVEQALAALHSRTRDRLARAVEGSNAA